MYTVNFFLSKKLNMQNKKNEIIIKKLSGIKIVKAKRRRALIEYTHDSERLVYVCLVGGPIDFWGHVKAARKHPLRPTSTPSALLK